MANLEKRGGGHTELVNSMSQEDNSLKAAIKKWRFVKSYEFSSSEVGNFGCSTFSYDSSNDIWTCVAPANSSPWGNGCIFQKTIIAHPGETIYIVLDVKPTVDCYCSVDHNNALGNGTPKGNDNDSWRSSYTPILKANQWTTVYLSMGNSYDMNTILYNAASNFGIVTGSSAINFQMRHVRAYVVDATITSLEV